MPKFVLLDHSLVNLGGHHFDYAQHMLRAAGVAGYQVVVGAHRNFRRPANWDSEWETHAVFPFTLYDEVAAHGSVRVDPTSADEGTLTKPSWIERLVHRSDRFQSQRQAAGMCRAMRQLFDRVEVSGADHVFLPTVGLFDFMCLAEFLRGHAASQSANWHVQFHYGPQATEGPARDALRAALEKVLASPIVRQVRFYATTFALTEQYRQLGFADCQTLPHHVNPAFVPAGHRPTAEGMLRVLCAGCPRQEKGYEHLSRIMLDLWSDYFGAGRAQLCLQAKPSIWMPNRPRRKVTALLGNAGGDQRFQTMEESQGPLAYVRFPLPMSDYTKLIQAADIGLFVYDVASYRHRCSGVLVEMLAAGVPVLVPGQCWMAEQIHTANAWCRERFPGSPDRRGYVGLVADAPQDIPQLLQEMLDHHAHYRACAVAHSETWRPEHSAENTLNNLLTSASHTKVNRSPNKISSAA